MSKDAPGVPAAEVNLDIDVITRLLADQRPDLAHLQLRIVGEGWDNLMVRVGDELALRIPRHAHGEKLLKHEQKWLPRLAPQLPLPVPDPVFIGVPDEKYPFTWSIVRWLPGEVAAVAPPDAEEAQTLATFLKALHRAAPDDAPKNLSRGCPLRDKQADTERRMKNIAHRTDLLTPKLLDFWSGALDVPIDSERVWLAGDIHPQNVLVRDGKFSAFIDWGDICSGDAATDLASIWMLFADQDARTDAISAYGMSEPTRLRAMGWAVFYGVILLEAAGDDPLHAASGEATLRRLNIDL